MDLVPTCLSHGCECSELLTVRAFRFVLYAVDSLAIHVMKWWILEIRAGFGMLVCWFAGLQPWRRMLPALGTADLGL